MPEKQNQAAVQQLQKICVWFLCKISVQSLRAIAELSQDVQQMLLFFSCTTCF